MSDDNEKVDPVAREFGGRRPDLEVQLDNPDFVDVNTPVKKGRK